MYTDKEIREDMAEHMRREMEIFKQINETIAIKTRWRAEEIVTDLAKQQGLQLSKEEFQKAVEHMLKKLESTTNTGSIVVNEIDL